MRDKKGFSTSSGQKTAGTIVSGFDSGGFSCSRVRGQGYSIAMLFVEAVQLGGGGGIEGIDGRGKCEKNGQQQDDHQ